MNAANRSKGQAAVHRYNVHTSALEAYCRELMLLSPDWDPAVCRINVGFPQGKLITCSLRHFLKYQEKGIQGVTSELLSRICVRIDT